MNEEVKLPPHDTDAEEAVLGSLLIDPNAYFKIFNIIRPNDFYRDKHRWVYESCVETITNGYSIDQITVAYELSRRHQLEAAGGPSFLAHLVSMTPTSVHIEHYAFIVWRMSFMRKLISAAKQIEELAYSMPHDIEGTQNKVNIIISTLSEHLYSKNKLQPRKSIDINRYKSS